MQYLIEGYEPKRLFEIFEEISAIPRGSGNEKGIADYICNFAEKLGLFYVRDKVDNVFVRKGSGKSYKDAPALLLQGHTDMVCEKNASTVHDFMRDPLKLCVKDRFVCAQGTTLGADDGVAVATMLALLELDEDMPMLECLFTVGEETCLVGAENFDYSIITSRKMINMDSEGEGVAVVSSAGGADVLFELRADRIRCPDRPIRIKVTGLAGGHSGCDIDTCRLNANRVMGRILSRLYEKKPFNLVTINGGNMKNAIARECVAEISVIDRECVNAELEIIGNEINAELCEDDKDFRIYVEKGKPSDSMLTYKDTSTVISLLTITPDGVYSMSPVFDRLVRTSCNCGVVETEGSSVRIWVKTRSSQNSEHEHLISVMKRFARIFDVHFEVSGMYEAWDYSQDSALARNFIRIYRELFPDSEIIPRTEAIHAGLECGTVISHLGECDAIAIGPNIYDIHSPNERLDLASFERFWKLMVALIKA